MISVIEMQTSYSDKEVFTVPALELEQGKITTVIGRNGSGKSTLLKSLCAQKSYTGSILIDGRESRSYPSRERARKIAYLPQILKSVNMDVLTLTEHGRYPYHGNSRRLTGTDRERIEYALEITDLAAYRHVNLRQMSGGERQRAYLAMIIAQDTPMVLLDEPTTYMDISYRRQFYEIMQRLKEDGKGVVMTCHDLEQSFAFSDTIVVMHDRTVKMVASPAEAAKSENELRSIFGVSIKAAEDDELVHTYLMKR